MKKTAEMKKSKTNPTTNFSMDSHNDFCKRCFSEHQGICPMTGQSVLHKGCSV